MTTSSALREERVVAGVNAGLFVCVEVEAVLADLRLVPDEQVDDVSYGVVERRLVLRDEREDL